MACASTSATCHRANRSLPTSRTRPTPQITPAHSSGRSGLPAGIVSGWPVRYGAGGSRLAHVPVGHAPRQPALGWSWRQELHHPVWPRWHSSADPAVRLHAEQGAPVLHRCSLGEAVAARPASLPPAVWPGDSVPTVVQTACSQVREVAEMETAVALASAAATTAAAAQTCCPKACTAARSRLDGASARSSPWCPLGAA